MISFILGCVVGCTVGVIIMSLCVISKGGEKNDNA